MYSEALFFIFFTRLIWFSKLTVKRDAHQFWMMFTPYSSPRYPLASSSTTNCHHFTVSSTYQTWSSSSNLYIFHSICLGWLMCVVSKSELCLAYLSSGTENVSAEWICAAWNDEKCVARGSVLDAANVCSIYHPQLCSPRLHVYTPFRHILRCPLFTFLLRWWFYY